MPPFPKYFTLKEAEALLPRLEVLVGEIVDLKSKIDLKVSSWQKQKKDDPVQGAIVQGQVDFLAGQINQRLDAVVQMGCMPKDLDKGLVDFPARLKSREVNLCWQLGEKKISFWHGLEEGFSNRKPLLSTDRKLV